VARLEGSATLTYFVHDGWNVVAEYAGSPGSSALAHEVRHVWGEDLGGGLQTAGGVGGLLASVRASGANWAHYDGNGNVVLLTDGAGAASARYAYDAFGKLKSSSGPAAEANRYRFSTKPQERAAALSYYGYRYYAPTLGRWLSRDPLGEASGMNLYDMIGNDTINLIDRLGLEAYIHHMDGTVRRTQSTAADLVIALSEAAPGSITELNIYGHADPDWQSLDSNDVSSKEGLKKRNKSAMPLSPCRLPTGPVAVTGPSLNKLLNSGFNPDAIINDASGEPAGYDLGALLSGKLAENAEINVRGCEAGNCKDASDKVSIARAISQGAPGATVSASTGNISRMGKLFGWWEASYPMIPGAGVTFKNGGSYLPPVKRILPPGY
jgi:RHS repeat-associated protein